MRKLISILLMSVLIMGICCGCGSDDNAASGKKEEIEWMPNGLKFGMTYDEAKSIHPEIPELDEAKANDGYFCRFEYPDNETAMKYFGFDTYCKYFDSDALHRTEYHLGVGPNYAYSFNQDKELYEFYVMYNTVYETTAEHMVNGFLTYYKALTDTDDNDIEKIENESGLEYQLEKDEVRIAIQFYEDMVIVVLHNTEYNLDS